jgi:hypothetical protein
VPLQGHTAVVLVPVCKNQTLTPATGHQQPHVSTAMAQLLVLTAVLSCHGPSCAFCEAQLLAVLQAASELALLPCAS